MGMRLTWALPALVAAACSAEPEQRNMSASEVAGELAALRIEPGLWEVSSAVVDVTAPNLPIALRREMIGPRGSLRHCIAPAQAARPSAGFLAGRGDGRCAYRDVSLQNGRLRGMMICTDEDGGPPIESVMDGRYGPRGYDLRMEMRNPMPDGTEMIVQVSSRGRRVGRCDEGREQ